MDQIVDDAFFQYCSECGEEIRLKDVTEHEAKAKAIHLERNGWQCDHCEEGSTPFEKQVAHGYFIISVAAGLFVDSYEKNPVLLNYGIDELRFTKPVYAGATIYVRFTCKEKTPQDPREENEIPRGIVKWLVEIIDETEEVVGVATILTMVARKAISF